MPRKSRTSNESTETTVSPTVEFHGALKENRKHRRQRDLELDAMRDEVENPRRARMQRFLRGEPEMVPEPDHASEPAVEFEQVPEAPETTVGPDVGYNPANESDDIF